MGLTKGLINGYDIFNGEKYFLDDGSQNYLIFEPNQRYFQTFTDTNKNSCVKI